MTITTSLTAADLIGKEGEQGQSPVCRRDQGRCPGRDQGGRPGRDQGSQPGRLLGILPSRRPGRLRRNLLIVLTTVQLNECFI